MFEDLWIEKYRPHLLADIVLTKENREIINKFSNSNEIPNLLFVGKAGIGKTSLAKIIVNNILQCQYLYINASDENGIETIRNKVTTFSKTKSFDGTIKVIILDEVDGLTLDAQRCLRNAMEEFSGYTRFILTANYKHKVINPLQSRCQSLDLVPPLKGFKTRLYEILESEQITVNESCDKSIESITKKYYPDLRKTINEIQKHAVNGALSNIDTTITNNFAKNIYKLVQDKKTLKLRKNIIENEAKFNADYEQLLIDLFNHVCDEKISDNTKREHLLVISEHIYRSAFVADQEINFFSCLLSLK